MTARAALCLVVVLSLACVSLPAGRRAPKADCFTVVDDQDRRCALQGPGCELKPRLQCGQLDAVISCECRCPGMSERPCPDEAR